MYLSSITAGQLTDVSTTPKHEVGVRYWRGDTAIPTAAHRGYGGQVWRYVKNGAGTALAAGNLVVRKDGATTLEVTRSPTTPISKAFTVGVAQHAIADGSYGWVLEKGVGIYLADGTGATINQTLVGSNATTGTFEGQAQTTAEITAATQSLGFAITAATSTTGVGYFSIGAL